MGRDSEADAVMDQALDKQDAGLLLVHSYGMRLLRASRNERALKISQLNQQRHPGEKFWPYYGLARAYTALNDKPNAIKNWEIAIANVPDNRKFLLPQFQAALKKLKEGT